MDLKQEQRICIKFCQKIGKTATETVDLIKLAFGMNSLSQSRVFEWFARFRDGRGTTEDDLHTGRPIASRTAERVEEISNLIIKDRRISVREIAEKVGMSFGTCQKILVDDLGLSRKSSKFVPKILSADQKSERVSACTDLLEAADNDPNFLKKVVTGDETWVYQYDPETKRQSSQWLEKNVPRPKKARMSKSKTKLLMVSFFDHKGLIHIEFLPNGQTVNQHVYLNILRRLRESIRKKRPEKWASGDWVLHHDNAPPHRALSVASFMAKNNMITLHHPPYSPDLAPSDFFLFPLLKSVLKGRRFETTEEIKEESLRVLKRITSDQFSSCFLNWAKRMKRCVDAQGEYFEEY